MVPNRCLIGPRVREVATDLALRNMAWVRNAVRSIADHMPRPAPPMNGRMPCVSIDLPGPEGHSSRVARCATESMHEWTRLFSGENPLARPLSRRHAGLWRLRPITKPQPPQTGAPPMSGTRKSLT